MPAKIRRITIEGFRGALRPVGLDFGSECRSMVLYGENGTGKSTFADAFEWYFFEKIAHLAREGCQDNAYRHRRLPPSVEASVYVEFDDPAYTGRRRLDAQRVAAFDCSGAVRQFVAYAGKDTFILRHGAMRDFVDKTKGEKLAHIAAIIGLEKLSAQRDQFASALRHLKNDSTYKTALQDIKAHRNDLGKLCSGRKFDPCSCITLAEQLRASLGGTLAISDLTTLAQSTKAVLALRSADNRETVAGQLQTQQELLEPAPTFTGICDEVAALESAVQALQADKRAVDEKVLAELYAAGQRVLDRQAGAADSCPLCGQPIDQDALYRSLSEELARIRTIQDRLERLRQQRADLRRRLDQWQVWAAKVAAATFDSSVADRLGLQSLALTTAALATRWANIIGADRDGLQPAPTIDTQDRMLAAEFTRVCNAAHVQLEDRRTKLAVSTQEQEYQRQCTQLESLNQIMQALARAERMAALYESQIKTVEAVTKQFEKLESDILQQVLDAISADVNCYYCKLHPEEGFDNVRLCPTTNRGLEFEFSFHGELISPPGALLSESHLNTLGVCLFLAAARYFNRSLRFLVLDDIVNSVDAGHRQSLGRMLRDDFGDVQILLLTHDDIWFEMMKKLVCDDWSIQTIGGWQYDTGFWMGSAYPDLDSEIRSILATQGVHRVGNMARRWFEYRLKRLCAELGLELPFRFNDANEHRELGDLLPKVKSYFLKTQKGSQNKALFNDLEAGQKICNLLSHDSPITSALPHANDVRQVLDDIQRFEALVTCPTCQKVVGRSKLCRCTPPFTWS